MALNSKGGFYANMGVESQLNSSTEGKKMKIENFHLK